MDLTHVQCEDIYCLVLWLCFFHIQGVWLHIKNVHWSIWRKVYLFFVIYSFGLFHSTLTFATILRQWHLKKLILLWHTVWNFSLAVDLSATLPTTQTVSQTNQQITIYLNCSKQATFRSSHTSRQKEMKWLTWFLTPSSPFRSVVLSWNTMNWKILPLVPTAWTVTGWSNTLRGWIWQTHTHKHTSVHRVRGWWKLTNSVFMQSLWCLTPYSACARARAFPNVNMNILALNCSGCSLWPESASWKNSVWAWG